MGKARLTAGTADSDGQDNNRLRQKTCFLLQTLSVKPGSFDDVSPI